MHVKLLQTVESAIERLDRNNLVRARLLLQSDYWSADTRLDHRKHLSPDQVAALEAERTRIGMAVDKIAVRIQELSAQKKGASDSKSRRR